MIAFDTDVLSAIFKGDPVLQTKFSAVPPADRWLPVVVIEEMLRGRLSTIRAAEAGKAKSSLEQAYALLEQTLAHFSSFRVLAYSAHADGLFKSWRAQKLKISTHDLRIAAICVSHGVTLASRNQRDFSQIPGLSLELW